MVESWALVALGLASPTPCIHVNITLSIYKLLINTSFCIRVNAPISMIENVLLHRRGLSVVHTSNLSSSNWQMCLFLSPSPFLCFSLRLHGRYQLTIASLLSKPPWQLKLRSSERFILTVISISFFTDIFIYSMVYFTQYPMPHRDTKQSDCPYHP